MMTFNNVQGIFGSKNMTMLNRKPKTDDRVFCSKKESKRETKRERKSENFVFIPSEEIELSISSDGNGVSSWL